MLSTKGRQGCFRTCHTLRSNVYEWSIAAMLSSGCSSVRLRSMMLKRYSLGPQLLKFIPTRCIFHPDWFRGIVKAGSCISLLLLTKRIWWPR